jgi:hypothetical protein
MYVPRTDEALVVPTIDGPQRRVLGSVERMAWQAAAVIAMRIVRALIALPTWGKKWTANELTRLMQRFDEFAHGCAGFG